jgi:hypothetical protein
MSCHGVQWVVPVLAVGDVERHKKAALWSQPDPSQGGGQRVTKQQQVGDTVRKERIRIEGDRDGRDHVRARRQRG